MSMLESAPEILGECFYFLTTTSKRFESTKRDITLKISTGRSRLSWKNTHRR